jgi:hypothetical protein
MNAKTKAVPTIQHSIGEGCPECGKGPDDLLWVPKLKRWELRNLTSKPYLPAFCPWCGYELPGPEVEEKKGAKK